MSWSLRLGRIAGIPVFVHWTFWILIAFYLWSSYAMHGNLREALTAVAFVLSLFGCVVLHEMGHALAARRYGIETKDITLLPIGGVARLERMPEKPSQELVVALAGPMVNVLIALILFPFASAAVSIDYRTAEPIVTRPFLVNLFGANVLLVLFNLIPAFPMDGGRVLRALLAMTMDYHRATRLAATIGQVVAIFFALFGLTHGQPMLLLIALFVWLGAEGEAAMVEERTLIGSLTTRAAMLTEYHTLSPSDTLGDAARELLAGAQTDFPVGDNGQFIGVLSRAALMDGLTRLGRDAPIREAMKPGLGSIEAGEPLVMAMSRLRENDEGPCLQVTERGVPIGLITLENISELLMIRAALSHAPDSQGQQSSSLIGKR